MTKALAEQLKVVCSPEQPQGQCLARAPVTYPLAEQWKVFTPVVAVSTDMRMTSRVDSGAPRVYPNMEVHNANRSKHWFKRL